MFSAKNVPAQIFALTEITNLISTLIRGQAGPYPEEREDQTAGLLPEIHEMKLSTDPPHNLTLLSHNTSPVQGLSFHSETS